jgi:hypothetical protein
LLLTITVLTGPEQNSEGCEHFKGIGGKPREDDIRKETMFHIRSGDKVIEKCHLGEEGASSGE